MKYLKSFFLFFWKLPGVGKPLSTGLVLSGIFLVFFIVYMGYQFLLIHNFSVESWKEIKTGKKKKSAEKIDLKKKAEMMWDLL